jgi:ATP-dependent DNA ligase
VKWLERFEGAGLDGVIVKPLGLPYLEGKREMLKVKHARTADCVVAGFRWHKDGEGVGSVLLGLFDDEGTMQYVGAVASFSAAERRRLVKELEPLRMKRASDHPWMSGNGEAVEPRRRPGGPSRWSAQRDMSWEPLRPERVMEVAYDHLQGERFRHVAKFVRWRPDRNPGSCTYAQLETAVPEELESVFGAGANAWS